VVKEETKASLSASKVAKRSQAKPSQPEKKVSAAAPQPKGRKAAKARKAKPPPRSRSSGGEGSGASSLKGIDSGTPEEGQRGRSIAEMAVQAGRQAALASAQKRARKVVSSVLNPHSAAEFAHLQHSCKPRTVCYLPQTQGREVACSNQPM